MPYRRRRYIKKRRPYRKRKDTVKKVRRAVRKLQKQVETKTYTLLQPEFDVLVAPTAFGHQPDDADVGPGNAQVVGRKYHCVGVKIRATLKKCDLATAEVGNIRFIGLWVNDVPSLESLVFGTYYQSVDDAGTPQAIPPFLANLRSTQSKNVKVLWDKTYSFGVKNAAGAYAAGNQQVNVNFYKTINRPVEFDNTLNRLTKGQFIMFALSQYNQAQTMWFTSKLYYKDP